MHRRHWAALRINNRRGQGHIAQKKLFFSLLVYVRKEPDGRLLLGGRGLFADPVSAKDYQHIERALAKLYPDLAPCCQSSP